MQTNTFVYILIKSDSSSFKIGFTTNLDETVDYYQDGFKLKFRHDRSFVFSGDYNQMKNLYILFTSLLKNYSLPSYLDEDLEDMFDIKALVLLNTFSETLGTYRIKTKKSSLRKTLEVCTPYRKVLSRKNKINLLFDFNLLEVTALEKKYNMGFEQLEIIYKTFYNDMYRPHRVEFKNYIRFYKGMNQKKEDLLNKI